MTDTPYLDAETRRKLEFARELRVAQRPAPLVSPEIAQRAKLKSEIDHHEALRKAKRSTLGLQYRERSSGSTVKPCGVCGAMVVDSKDGWKAHRARMPRCAV
jgi:hypothetical protein